tara:strand:+ start:781 stop:1053 length:273 start_codon:yes stop_codon:yes gene_type:complete
MPIDRYELPIEVQEAWALHDLLSDRWEGMSGSYLGKDYSALETYIKVLEIENPKISLYFLKHIDYFHSEWLNAKVKAKRDAEKRKSKMKR